MLSTQSAALFEVQSHVPMEEYVGQEEELYKGLSIR